MLCFLCDLLKTYIQLEMRSRGLEISDLHSHFEPDCELDWKQCLYYIGNLSAS